jgi:hypothetical protein
MMSSKRSIVESSRVTVETEEEDAGGYLPEQNENFEFEDELDEEKSGDTDSMDPERPDNPKAEATLCELSESTVHVDRCRLPPNIENVECKEEPDDEIIEDKNYYDEAESSEFSSMIEDTTNEKLRCWEDQLVEDIQ